MFGGLTQEFRNLTGRGFATFVAYMLGLGVIFWCMELAVALFNEVNEAIKDDDVRRIAFNVTVSLVLMAVSTWIGGRILSGMGERARAGIEEAGKKLRKTGEESLAKANEAWDEVAEARAKVTAQQQEMVAILREKGLWTTEDEERLNH